MIYICAELFIRGQHGYRLVSDTFEKMDAPDKTVELLITQGRLSRNAKRVKLPVLEDGKVRGNKEILTFIAREYNNLICSNYNGDKIILSDIEILGSKFSNAEVVELIGPGNILIKTLLGNWESYKDVVDSFYDGRGMTVQRDKLDRAITRASMIASNYTIDTDGVLHAGTDNKDRLMIPDGVIDTDVLSGFKHICGGRTLNRLKIEGRNGLVDLSKCNNLIEVEMIRNPSIAEFIPNENITNISSFNTLHFEDWKYLKYRTGNFKGAHIDEMRLGKSIIQTEVPKRFALGCKIIKLVIDGNINSLDDEAFYSIGNVREIYIGDNIRKIGRLAFGSSSSVMYTNYSGFVQVRGLKGVESIGDFAFQGISYLDLNLSELKNLKSIGKGAFSECAFNNQTVKLPDSVKVVGKDAFNLVEIMRLSPNLTDKSIENILNMPYIRILHVPESIMHRVKDKARYCQLIVEKAT